MCLLCEYSFTKVGSLIPPLSNSLLYRLYHVRCNLLPRCMAILSEADLFYFTTRDTGGEKHDVRGRSEVFFCAELEMLIFYILFD